MKLDGFHNIESIYESGVSKVYRAKDSKQRNVVLKTLKNPDPSPLEIALMQSEFHFLIEFKHLDWSPVTDDEENIERLLVSIKDVTALRIFEDKAKKQERELTRINKILSIGTEPFVSFISQAEGFLTRMESIKSKESDEEKFRATCAELHTFKAVSRKYHLDDLSDLIHEAENVLVKQNLSGHYDEKTKFECIDAIKSTVEDYKKLLFMWLNPAQLESKQNHQDVLWKFRQKNLKEAPNIYSTPDLISVTKEYFCAVAGIFISIDEEAKSISNKLSKPTPRLKIQSLDVFFTKAVEQSLESIFLHPLSNSLVHGLESAEERVRAGKPKMGTISIMMSLEPNGLKFIYKDDGGGLDLVKISEQKTRKPQCVDQIAESIFFSGLSTTKELDQYSGRGFGLDAVKSEIEDWGGSINVVLSNKDQSVTTKAPFSYEIRLPNHHFIAINLDEAA
ncbi:MAG: hypothetical protein HRU09_17815 [Oligoflexales bacterium]|nr:hypothetical protein [Oligoflexales bacterium]